MRPSYLLDTGPLVAYLHQREEHHYWAKSTLSTLMRPLLTCESVLSEACFLLEGSPVGVNAVLDLVSRGALEIPFRLTDECDSVARLMRRYATVPMSLADACLVRMAEQISGSVVVTLDGDFAIYRKNGRQVIPTMMPPARR
ncbi:MAG: PIN domain-containing protein [Candidatus Wallbacteria bacterium]|nr:PIN domain-containing protein [Candidatus Wallbacteria bacterium]